ncbi:MAG: Crp/Fnr family transcriptional regulator [Candidatus Eremiobacteraeota bacterium]|nr:Crp/Fnr family transcriptional regulator [Candidatus Eremiobacteraeota bacterium]
MTEKNESRLQENAILTHLQGEDRAAAVSDGSIVHFALKQTVYDAEARIKEVYFPLDSVLSVVTYMDNGMMIEVGTIGREGMSGIPLLMGSDSTSNMSFCQVDGDCWKMSASLFRSLLDRSETFRKFVNRYLQAYVNMLGQFAACNRLHSVYERASRWILMTQDRVGEDQFPLTHEFLATMLGSRRSGVTIAASQLQKAGFITYHRGRITVTDRAGLEDTACECYRLAKSEFDAMLRPAATLGNGAGAHR